MKPSPNGKTLGNKFVVFTAVSNAGFLFHRFYDYDGILNAQKYQHLVLHPLVKKLNDENLLETSILMQEGAKAKSSMAYLRSIFGNRIISHNGEFDWAAASLDLNVGFFYLFGIL
jgi:hypothetical protein